MGGVRVRAAIINVTALPPKVVHRQRPKAPLRSRSPKFSVRGGGDIGNWGRRYPLAFRLPMSLVKHLHLRCDLQMLPNSDHSNRPLEHTPRTPK